MKLKGKVVVITGGSKGLGKALAIALGAEGARVIIAASGKKVLETAAKESGIPYFVADVSKEEQVQKLARFAENKLGSIDIWVNCAGITIPHSDLESISSRDAHKLMEVNFFGTFYGSREALKMMKKQKQGAILNIVSASSLVGRPRSLAYSSSKWAARGFTEGLRLAAKPFGVLVLAVHPGGMKTTIFGKHLPKGYENWMMPQHAADRIVENLKRTVPRSELVIEK